MTGFLDDSLGLGLERSLTTEVDDTVIIEEVQERPLFQSEKDRQPFQTR